jgi:threonyl-tRNA synthetase
MAPDRVVPVQSEEAAYVAHRIAIFDELYAKQKQEAAEKPRDAITATLPDGKEIPGQAWETSPAIIARGISKSLFERTVIARVDGELWDIGRPLEKSCRLELLDFTNDEAKKVFWHSSAHILGEAAEKKFHCHLCFGPPTDDGFFYDFGMPTAGTAVTADDKKTLSSLMEGIVKEKQPFERLVMSKEDLLRMFSNNKFKIELINSKIPDGESTTVYRNGPLIDLCRGPHVIDTGRIKALTVLKVCPRRIIGCVRPR